MKKPREFNFDLKQLRSFLEVTREKSFTRASRNLRVGQATISTHISSLEEVFGVELIKRTSKEFAVTREGDILRSFCEELLAGIDELKASLARTSPPGSITVAASTIPSAYIIPRVISRVRNDFPGTAFRIEISDSREAVEMIKEGRAELGVTGRMLKHPAVSYEKIIEDEVVLIAPVRGFPDSTEIGDISSFPFITREKGSGTRDAFERELAKRGISPSDLNIILESSTSEGVREAVAAGLGMAFISRFAVPRDRTGSGIKIVRVKDFEIRRDFYLVYLKNRKLSPPVSALIRELKGLKGSIW